MRAISLMSTCVGCQCALRSCREDRREGRTNLVIQRREGGDEDALENCRVVPVDRHRDGGGCVVLVSIFGDGAREDAGAQ
jgi:hypothetical protein